MKKNTIILVILLLVIAVAAAGIFLTRENTKSDNNYTIESSMPDIPSESTVDVPEPDRTDIENIATFNIPTKAAAGSQSHAIYTSYTETEAKGYLTYEADQDNPASFSVVKKDGKWEVESYKVLGETDL